MKQITLKEYRCKCGRFSKNVLCNACQTKKFNASYLKTGKIPKGIKVMKCGVPEIVHNKYCGVCFPDKKVEITLDPKLLEWKNEHLEPFELDEHGYPTDESLTRITAWDYRDKTWHKLMGLIKEIWSYAELKYWKQRNRMYFLSTGGWSGNEDIIRALQANRMFWAICWFSSKRGGHYKFEIPKGSK